MTGHTVQPESSHIKLHSTRENVAAETIIKLCFLNGGKKSQWNAFSIVETGLDHRNKNKSLQVFFNGRDGLTLHSCG